MNPERWVEPKKAAEILGISTATITRARKQGAPTHPVSPSGRKYKVDVFELAEWFRQQEENRKEKTETTPQRPTIYALRAARRAAIG